MKKLFVLFFMMVCAFSKNGYAMEEEKENQKVKKLQSQISFIPIYTKPVTFPAIPLCA